MLEAYYDDEAGKSIAVGENGDSPVIKVKGRKRVRTSKARVRLKGTATDSLATTAVTYQVGRKIRTAKGTANWSFKLRVKPGRTKVKVFATDAAGNVSRPAKVTVIRN